MQQNPCALHTAISRAYPHRCRPELLSNMTLPTRLPPSIRRVWSGALLSLVASTLSAHPHVWITYSSVIHMRGVAITSVSEVWRFTEGFPVILIGIDQLPPSGPLGRAQTEIFRKQAFSSLATAEYFTHLLVDGEPQHFASPADFKVSVEDGHIQYTFTLQLAKPVSVAEKKVQFGIWDESFYVDYEPVSGPAVSLDHGAASTCRTQTFADRKHPIFYGNVVPQATAITC